MLGSIQYILFLLFFIVVQVLAQNYYKPSITCYMKYEHEETRSKSTNNVLHYSYHESEATHYKTAEGESCSTGACACFSYRSVCSGPPVGTHYFSQCTTDDERNRVIKWYRGMTSKAKCEEMRGQPQTYLDLTCCYEDKCNNQPGKTIKITDTEIPSQPYTSYNHQGPQPLPMSHNPPYQYDGRFAYQPGSQHIPDIHNQPYRHDGHVYNPVTSRTPATYRSSQRYDSHVRYQSTTRSTDTYGASPAYDKSLTSNSFLRNSVSNWMIIFTLLICFLIKI